MSTSDADLEARRRGNGQFGESQHSAPETKLLSPDDYVLAELRQQMQAAGETARAAHREHLSSIKALASQHLRMLYPEGKKAYFYRDHNGRNGDDETYRLISVTEALVDGEAEQEFYEEGRDEWPEIAKVNVLLAEMGRDAFDICDYAEPINDDWPEDDGSTISITFRGGN